jgi:predicted ArsR family transcriptional regulator
MLEGTRWAVLNALKVWGRATVNQLADSVGVKPITVRHHLKTLSADGLITAEIERQHVGRPHYVYSLTEEAQNLFPQKYHMLAERLLEQLKDALPPEMVETFLDQIALAIAREVEPDLKALSLEERLAAVAQILSSEGYMARWERDADAIRVIEHHCPYYLISRDHPEICRIGETLMRAVLHADVTKDACLIDGDECCTFRIMPLKEK